MKTDDFGPLLVCDEDDCDWAGDIDDLTDLEPAGFSYHCPGCGEQSLIWAPIATMEYINELKRKAPPSE